MLLVAAITVGACQEPGPATQVRVEIDAEPLVRAETDRLAYVVRGGDAEYPQLPVREMQELRTFAWPLDVTVAPAGGDATRVFELEVTALDVAGRIVAQVRVRMSYTPGVSRVVRLWMEDRCRGIACGEGLTCRGARCVPADPPEDGGLERDAGVPPPCSTSADCDDGVFCNGVETCVDGACIPGDRPDCADRYACTEDRCEVSGCVHIPVAARCSAAPGGRCDELDGCQYPTCETGTTCVAEGCERVHCEGSRCVREYACGSSEICCGESCQPAGCDDGNPCTLDFCEPTAGACAHRARAGGTCSDGDACTTGDACIRGSCVGSPRTCPDDGNACTTEMCSASGGCQSVEVDGVACSDGDACTSGDLCGGGRCIPGAPMPCDDGIPCTDDGCAAGACTHAAVDARCPAGARCVVGTGCVFSGACDPTTCAASAGPCQTATCSGSTCVVSGGCAAGQTCCGGACVSCDDGNPCTADACSGGSCSSTPIGGPCSDGNPCTMGDVCGGGVCTGAPIVCDDGNACTVDRCEGGACRYDPAPGGAPCNDGNACTTGDACSGTTCAGAPLSCNDLNVCTLDSCNPATGCVYTPQSEGGGCGLGEDCVAYRCRSGECRPEALCMPPRACCGGICTLHPDPDTCF